MYGRSWRLDSSFPLFPFGAWLGFDPNNHSLVQNNYINKMAEMLRQNIRPRYSMKKRQIRQVM